MNSSQVFDAYEGPKFIRRRGLKWEVGIGWNATLEGFGDGGMQARGEGMWKRAAIWACVWQAVIMGCPGILERLNASSPRG